MIKNTLSAIGVVSLLTACATPKNHYDPFEPVNRVMFTINDNIDHYAIKPLAKTYVNYTPGPIKQGVSNFTSNISDVNSVVGNMLEGHIIHAAKDIGRIVVNTVFGMFGLVDWASDIGLPKQGNNIGNALGRWGLGTGPYLILPLFGPMTIRDSTDAIFNWTVGVPAHFDHRGNYSYALVNGLDTRAKFLPIDKTLDELVIFDKYSYIRDSYLQKRYHDVYQDNPPKPFELGEAVNDNDNKSQ
jgi:phospholipid-binding lipoprotein MlaA